MAGIGWLNGWLGMDARDQTASITDHLSFLTQTPAGASVWITEQQRKTVLLDT